MLCYVIFGGMLATTWVQIIKAVLLMAGIVVMSMFVLEQGRLQPDRAVQPRGGEHRPPSRRSRSRPGTFLDTPIDTVSLGLALVLGTAGPAAHPDALLHRARRARRARLGRLGDVPDRLLLPADHVHRLRRARRSWARAASRRPARAATSRRRTWRQELGGGAGHVRRRPLPRGDRRRRLRDDPRRRGGPGAERVGRGGARHLVEHHPQAPRLRARGGLGREDRRRGRSA